VYLLYVLLPSPDVLLSGRGLTPRSLYVLHLDGAIPDVAVRDLISLLVRHSAVRHLRCCGVLRDRPPGLTDYFSDFAGLLAPIG